MGKILIIAIVLLILSVLVAAEVFVSKNSDAVKTTTASSSMTLNVAIPCPGHASLIKSELEKLDGVTSINYTPTTTFVVNFDSTKISEQDILSLDIFKEYPAVKIE